MFMPLHPLYIHEKEDTVTEKTTTHTTPTTTIPTTESSKAPITTEVINSCDMNAFSLKNDLCSEMSNGHLNYIYLGVAIIFIIILCFIAFFIKRRFKRTREYDQSIPLPPVPIV